MRLGCLCRPGIDFLDAGGSLVRRARGALAARGTRRESVHGGSMAASMPPTVPQAARAPHQNVGRQFDWGCW
ncbi:hypothetical protein C7T79_16825 [Xanthomonas oryzae pv. oryzicola]|nr:hypothetical protein C7T79_16825 [Xanthomonas oryzae pv. oryzicola]